MNIAFKIMFFTLCLNVSVGIISTVIGETTLHADRSIDEISGDVDIFASSITPGEVGSGQNNFWEDLLSKITFGYYNKIKDFVSNYLYGFVNIIFGQFFDLPEAILIVMRTLITLVYAFGLIWLFTGKSPTSEVT